MRQLSLILILLALALLQGCGSNKERDDGADAEQLYQEARKVLAAKDYPSAVQLYRNLTIRFPFGRHAEQAMLDMAYAQYKGAQAEAAIATLDRFIKTYPTHPNVDYAWYLKGLVNYDQTMSFLRKLLPGRASDRDQQGAHQAFRDFQELIRLFPDSRYIADA